MCVFGQFLVGGRWELKSVTDLRDFNCRKKKNDGCNKRGGNVIICFDFCCLRLDVKCLKMLFIGWKQAKET